VRVQGRIRRGLFAYLAGAVEPVESLNSQTRGGGGLAAWRIGSWERPRRLGIPAKKHD
jgi:hypothetical protein